MGTPVTSHLDIRCSSTSAKAIDEKAENDQC